ncbi:MYCBP-associated protein-like [Danaus plexippus]|uniref:MYCBP-associated protein-like n=1 Tax=Danaus plexippus TaxID=13037 RepID=UPI002AB2049A|nr:MYCBP-associated protein-like [Danaus plexippus]
MSNKDFKNIDCFDYIEPDRELLAWEKWIKIRKEETTHLAQRLGRDPAELEMNIFENRRQDKERKITLEHAQIEKKVGIRGSLWEQPQRLKQGCYCEPAYELQRTRAEMGRPRIIQHIGVPMYIQETEKGISGVSKRNPCTKLNAEYVKYRAKREKELEENIKTIDPFRPEIKDLVVVGTKPKTPPKKMPSVPVISIILQNEPLGDFYPSIYAVRINDTVFFKNTPPHDLHSLHEMQKQSWHVNCNSWSYYFNCPVKRVGRSKLFLQNLGTVTLKYCWKKLKPVSVEDYQEPVFFFNRNENVICPGQTQYIYFTFISGEPGSYRETWELIFYNVSFYESVDKAFKVNLYADSTENFYKIKKKIEKLENFIYNILLRNIARDLLHEIITKSTSVQPQVYPYKEMFLEAEMFVMKNPVCYYHQTEVMKMKNFYEEMVVHRQWDLSISSWRLEMMKKDYEERMKYFDLLKSSHKELQKPWYEKNDLFEQKYKAVYELLGQFASKLDYEYTRIPSMFFMSFPEESQIQSSTTIQESPAVVTHIFFLRAYEHFSVTIELCAGILSSLDLNRWIHFDFCRT